MVDKVSRSSLSRPRCHGLGTSEVTKRYEEKELGGKSMFGVAGSANRVYLQFADPAERR